MAARPPRRTTTTTSRPGRADPVVLASAWHAIADPWSSGIMARALAEIVLVGIAGGTLGCWVVLHRASYAAESLAHALFPGLVAAALLGLPLLAGGLAGVIVAALAIALASRIPWVQRDTAVAVAVTTLFGLGALLALSARTPPGLQELLFGDVLGVSPGDVRLAALLAAGVVAILALLHARLLASGFDPSVAASLGAAPRAMTAVLLVLVALTIVVAVQGLGNLLVVAVLIGPAAAARRRSRRVGPMLALAAGLATLAGVAGLYLSYYAGVAAGASIALAMVAAYAICAALPGPAPGARTA